MIKRDWHVVLIHDTGIIRGMVSDKHQALWASIECEAHFNSPSVESLVHWQLHKRDRRTWANLRDGHITELQSATRLALSAGVQAFPSGGMAILTHPTLTGASCPHVIFKTTNGLRSVSKRMMGLSLQLAGQWAMILNVYSTGLVDSLREHHPQLVIYSWN
jgi:hypothetical protein